MKKQIGKPLMQKWKNKIGGKLSALDKKKLVLTNLPSVSWRYDCPQSACSFYVDEPCAVCSADCF